MLMPSIMVIWVVWFSKGGKKLDRFLAKNQYFKRKLFWTEETSWFTICVDTPEDGDADWTEKESILFWTIGKRI